MFLPYHSLPKTDSVRSGAAMTAVYKALIAAVACLAFSCVSEEHAARLCDACRRPIHGATATLADLGGRSKTFCCPACALSARMQAGDRFRITSFTDYATGSALRPDAALLVRGSDVNLCARTQPLIDESREAHPVHYDRCMPSIIAFGDTATATRFMREHGGTIVHLDDLLRGE